MAQGHSRGCRGTFLESKKPNRYQGYLAAMSNIVQSEPGSFEDAVKHQVWKDAMHKEYESIMKNDVWDVVPRLEDKEVVTSKWLYKIKHGSDGSAENHLQSMGNKVYLKENHLTYHSSILVV